MIDEPPWYNEKNQRTMCKTDDMAFQGYIVRKISVFLKKQLKVYEELFEIVKPQRLSQ